MIAAPGLTSAPTSSAVVSRNPTSGGSTATDSLRCWPNGSRRSGFPALPRRRWRRTGRRPPPRRRQPRRNRSAPAPLGWENGSIGGFLDAAATWGRDSRDGLPGYSGRRIPGGARRSVMLAGKFYE
ncbi:hypothetical protein ACPA9J_33665 [Pseudomonas aeruginosa]